MVSGALGVAYDEAQHLLDRITVLLEQGESFGVTLRRLNLPVQQPAHDALTPAAHRRPVPNDVLLFRQQSRRAAVGNWHDAIQPDQ